MNRNDKYQMDMLIEAGVSQFLDDNFYGKLKAETHRWKDKEHQFAGIDTTINNTNFDEKIKIRGCLNSTYQYPSFEMSLVNKGGYVDDGWFTKPLSTDYYAFIGVYSYGNDENAISCPNEISACDVLWVKKQDVIDMVEEETSMEELKSDAEELREDDFMPMQKKRKTYSHHKFWLTYSAWMHEKPVNLVVPRNTLEKLPHSRHFLITTNKITIIKGN